MANFAFVKFARGFASSVWSMNSADAVWAVAVGKLLFSSVLQRVITSLPRGNGGFEYVPDFVPRAFLSFFMASVVGGHAGSSGIGSALLVILLAVKN